MTKILAIGGGLPEFNLDRRLVAVSYRTEQLVTPLLDDGHDVTVLATSAYDLRGEPRVSRKGRLVHFQVESGRDALPRAAQRLHDEIRPDCVLGIGRMDAIVAAALKTDAPLWVDLFGDPNCEAQSKAHAFKDDYWVRNLWDYDAPFFERADAFSTCGTYQEHFLTGVLSMLGRLSWRTFGYRFAYAIPPGIRDDAAEDGGGEKLLRGRCLGKDDFAVLWCGGYNVWTDIDTLFAGCEAAFAADGRIRFVSLGGSIDGHDEQTYPRFCKMVEGSRYRDRFILLGWRSCADARRAYRECDLGISIDAYHYEPVYGTRTRIIEMVQNRLPVLTSVGCELSHIMGDHGLGLTFETGDPARLAERIIGFAKEPRAARDALAEKAYRYFRERYTYEKTVEPLRAWARRPLPSPDRDAGVRPVLPVRLHREHWQRYFEENPGEISLKRLLRNKVRSRIRVLFRMGP